MSSISSVSNPGQGLFQYLQQINGGSQSPIGSASDPSVSGATTATAAATTGTGQPVQGAHHHHHGGAHGALFQKVQSAVTDALNSAKANGSTDPNSVVQAAIEKVFQEN